MGKGWKGRPKLEMGWVGFDPGQNSGGIAHVTGPGKGRAWKMPGTTKDLWDLVDYLAPYTYFAVLEKVHAMKGQGVSSTFKFGENFGKLQGVIAAAGMRHRLVTPNEWQTTMKCRTGGDKNVTKRKAQELWPTIKITHAFADALLMGEFGRLYEK